MNIDIFSIAHFFQVQADNICASLGQCFQWAYQEATMQLLQKTIDEASIRSDRGIASSDGKVFYFLSQYYFFSYVN